MKIAKGLLGIAIWIVLGFLVYCTVMGVLFMAGMILTHLAWWQILIGTTGGCLVVYGVLLDKLGD